MISLKELTLVTLASFGVTSIGWWALTADFGPTPYTNPTMAVIYRTATHVDIAYSFVKTEDCTFQKWSFFGEDLGTEFPVDWTDLGGSKGATRESGKHFTIIRVYTPSNSLESIKTSTRHDCDGVSVEREFGEVDVPPSPEGATAVQEQLQEQRSVIENLLEQVETLSQEVLK